MVNLPSFCCFAAVCGLLVHAPRDTQRTDRVYVAIGASDTWGVGSTRPCLVPCLDGNGYVQRFARQQLATGHPFEIVNRGVPGARLSLGTGGEMEISDTVEDQFGAFPAGTVLVTVWIGSNEALGLVALSLEDEVLRARSKYVGRRISALIRRSTAQAATARFIVLNVPNLAATPGGHRRPAAEQRQLAIVSKVLTSAINALASRSVRVLDVMCDELSYSPGSYAGDGYHPNDVGYSHIADQLETAVTASRYPKPASHCPKMTAGLLAER